METIINTLNAITNFSLDFDLFEYGQIDINGYNLNDNEYDELKNWLDLNATHVKQSMDSDEYHLNDIDLTIMIDWYGEDI